MLLPGCLTGVYRCLDTSTRIIYTTHCGHCSCYAKAARPRRVKPEARNKVSHQFAALSGIRNTSTNPVNQESHPSKPDTILIREISYIPLNLGQWKFWKESSSNWYGSSTSKVRQSLIYIFGYIE